MLYWEQLVWLSIHSAKSNFTLAKFFSHSCRCILGFCLVSVCIYANAQAQVVADSLSGPVLIASPADTSKLNVTTASQDFSQSSNAENSQPANSSNRSSAVQDAVEFQSTDSLIVDFRNGRKATLYGSAKVSHTAASLSSGTIDMDLETSTVEATASSTQDTLAMPVLTRESDEIRSRRILFNYKTQKGKFEEAQIKVGEGQLIGSKVKNVSETEVFIEDGIYSTCPPEYLYYYLKAERMKVVDQDEIFFTNARLYILDIPYPLVFPFGYVPSGIEQKQSGLLTPTYVFDAKSTRGVGLNNVGWFQYLNDYVTTTLSGDVYTSGTFFLNSTTQYRNSDIYSGSVSLGYSKSQGLEPTDPNFTRTVNRNIGIQHNQTISPFASINANINIRTADFFTENSLNIDDRAQTTSQSRMAFKYNHPERLFNFSTNASLSQDFSNNRTTLRGPSSSFSLKSLSPLQNPRSGSTPKWYESLTIQYSNKLNTEFDYDPIDEDSATVSFLDALTDRSLYREATGDDDYIRLGVQHSTSASVNGIIPSNFINTSANISSTEYWYPSSIRKVFNEETNSVETIRDNGFTAGRTFSTGFSFSTTVYGLSTAKVGKLEGFRHTFSPTLGFSFRPDFSKERFNYYRTVQSDTLGNEQTYSIFEDGIFGGPGRGESRSLTFSIKNVFETKIVDRDSTGEVNERVLKLIDNFQLRSSYNFAADSLNLANLNAEISSNAFKGLNLRARAEFDFYQRNESGRRVDRFLFEEGRIAQMQRLTISASTSFKGGRNGIEPFTPIYRKVYDPLNQGIFSAIDPGYGYEPVAPLNSAWSFGLNFNYSWRYRPKTNPDGEDRIDRTATINATNISFNLTPKWSFQTRIGYDLIEKELTPSQFNLNRSLECWNLSFQISPFGENQYYFFKLSVNSQQIQSLFQKLPVLRNLERGSSRTGTTQSGFSRFN